MTPLTPEEIATLEISPLCVRPKCGHRQVLHDDGHCCEGGCQVTGCKCESFCATERELHPPPVSDADNIMLGYLREMNERAFKEILNAQPILTREGPTTIHFGRAFPKEED